MSLPKVSALIFALLLSAVSHWATPVMAEFPDSIKIRGDLKRARESFEQTKRGTVAFIGGSITQMNGYRPMVMQSLRERFPETEFSEINAGIASTCSHTGAFRLGRDVLAHKPDLLFVEFAVNDDQDAAHSLRNAVRGMEGILRQARSVPDLEIVVTHFVNPTMLKKVQSGDTPVSIEAHESVAKHYGVTTCNVAVELAKRITAGTITWQVYGGTHPKPAGNRVAADLIDRVLDKAMSATDTPRAKSRVLPDPLDSTSFFNGRLRPQELVQLGDGWRYHVPKWDDLPGSFRSQFAEKSLAIATEPNAELSFETNATAVGLYVLAGPDAGAIEYSVDDGAFERVDLYHRFSKGLHYPRTVVLRSGMDDKKKKITIRVSEVSNDASQGHAVRILQFVES
ncbi:MAG: SGNH/GDSL hydrolase family protein, partial [Planctomycetota bacterium]